MWASVWLAGSAAAWAAGVGPAWRSRTGPMPAKAPGKRQESFSWYFSLNKLQYQRASGPVSGTLWYSGSFPHTLIHYRSPQRHVKLPKRKDTTVFGFSQLLFRYGINPRPSSCSHRLHQESRMVTTISGLWIRSRRVCPSGSGWSNNSSMVSSETPSKTS